MRTSRALFGYVWQKPPLQYTDKDRKKWKARVNRMEETGD
jgi:hypothetical protein